MIKRATLYLAASALLALGTSCVDNVDDYAGPTGYSTQQQPVVVAPQFEIVGVDELPDNLQVTEIGLRVSEILLQPIDRPNSLSYSFSRPFAPRFALAEGETVRSFDGVEVPQGRYLVSLRLEPVPLEETDVDPTSFEMYGFVAEGPSLHNDEVSSDGTPVPLPFKEGEGDDRDENEFTDRPDYPEQWTPFIYESKKTEFFTFSNVEFTPGEQYLTFRFDVRSWAFDVVQPISKAVRNGSANDEGVDATNVIEGSGAGARALIESGEVEILRR